MLRSKNAGPFYLTFDIIFQNEETYQKVVDASIITKEKIAKLYGCNIEEIELFLYEKVSAIKVSIPRKYPSGDLYDTDVFGAQQHVPLMMLEI